MTKSRSSGNAARANAHVSGLHTSYKELADGTVCIYAYVNNARPRISEAVGPNKEVAKRNLERILGNPDTLEKLVELRRPQIAHSVSRRQIDGLVSAFLESAEYAKLSSSTKRDYKRYLTLFKKEFEDWKISLFEKPAIVEDIADWRDDTWPDKLAAADYAMRAVSRLFSWARRRGWTSAEPTRDIERLYSSNRSDIIWTNDDLRSFSVHASDGVQLGTELGFWTGLRQGDLLNLPWSAVGSESISWRTSKRGRVVVVPLLEEAKEVLARIPRRSPLVLTSSLNKPWTSDGFRTSFRRARDAANLKPLRFHDLRGTAVTRFAIAGLSNDEIARVIGWEKSVVDDMLALYLSGDAMAIDMLDGINQKRRLTNR